MSDTVPVRPADRRLVQKQDGRIVAVKACACKTWVEYRALVRRGMTPKKQDGVGRHHAFARQQRDLACTDDERLQIALAGPGSGVPGQAPVPGAGCHRQPKGLVHIIGS